MKVESGWQEQATDEYEEMFKEDLLVAESELIGDFIHVTLGGGFESCQD